MGIVSAIVFFLRALLGNRAVIVAENLALRQQLAVLKRSVRRPRLRKRDRILWVWMSRLWPSWRSSLVIVKPELVKGRKPALPQNALYASYPRPVSEIDQFLPDQWHTAPLYVESQSP